MMLYSCRMPRISPGLPLPSHLSLPVSLSSPLSPCHPVCFPFLLIHCPPLPPLHSAIHPQVQPLSLSLCLLAGLSPRPPDPPVRPRLRRRRPQGGRGRERTDGRTGKEEEERREKESPVRLSLSPPSSNSDPLSQPSSLTDCNLGLRIDAFPAC